MSALLQAQFDFTRLVPRLLDRACTLPGVYANGKEWYRTPEQAALNAQRHVGVADSLHCEGLALDLLLFTKQGDLFVLLPGDASAYATVGAYWKTLDPRCRWGGDFSTPDYDHFSLTLWPGRG